MLKINFESADGLGNCFYQRSLPNNGHRSCTKLESVEPYNPHCNPLDQSGFCQEIHTEHSINGKAHPAKSV